MKPSHVLQSGMPWLRLDVAFDAEQMLSEARKLESRFVAHRESTGRGWSSVCLHGLGDAMTQSANKYGFADDVSAPLNWTPASADAPTICAFVSSLPLKRLHRVRIMKLESFGYILPHSDTARSQLAPINVAINQPDGCMFKMEGHGIVPFEAASAFLLDVSNRHALLNLSAEDRYHVIIHSTFPGDDDLSWRSLLARSMNKYRPKSYVEEAVDP